MQAKIRVLLHFPFPRQRGFCPVPCHISSLTLGGVRTLVHIEIFAFLVTSFAPDPDVAG